MNISHLATFASHSNRGSLDFGKGAELFRCGLDQMNKDRGKKPYANFVPIIQSSGMGKSRLVDETAPSASARQNQCVTFAVRYEKPLTAQDLDLLKEAQEKSPSLPVLCFQISKRLDDLAAPSWHVDILCDTDPSDPWPRSDKSQRRPISTGSKKRMREQDKLEQRIGPTWWLQTCCAPQLSPAHFSCSHYMMVLIAAIA